MARYLLISATVILSSCCTVPPHVPFECPDRPVFTEYTEELWFEIPGEAQQNISDDDLSMKAYIKECEARAEIHNED